MNRHQKYYLFLAVLVLFLSRLVPVWFLPVQVLDLLVPDDSWMYLSLADSISAGLGPRYADTLTNGFQPLFLMMLSGVWEIYLPESFMALRLSLSIGAVSELIGFLGLLNLISLFRADYKVKIWTTALWIFNPYAFAIALNGLETSLAFASALWALVALIRVGMPDGRYSSLRSLFVGAVFGLACLARIDALILSGIAFSVFTFTQLRKDSGQVNSWLNPITFLVGFLIFFLPWPIWSRINVGYWLPISGSATRFQSLFQVLHKPTIANWYWPMVATTYATVFLNNFGLLIIGYTVYRLSGRKWFLVTKPVGVSYSMAVYILFSWCVGLYLAYTFYVFGPWYFERYYFPTLPLIVLMIIPTVHYLANHLTMKHWRVFLLSSCAVVLFFGCIGSRLPRWIRGNSLPSVFHYIPVASWVKENVSKGAVVGAVQSGAIGYLVKGIKVINLDGKVNPAVFDSLVDGKAIEYARHAGVTHLVGFPDNIAMILYHSVPSQFQSLEMLRRQFRSLKMLHQSEIDNRTWQIWEVLQDSSTP